MVYNRMQALFETETKPGWNNISWKNLVKRAGTVQFSLFLPKFLPCFLASCRKWRVFKSELAAWQAEQAHISSKEKQEVPDGELPVLLIVCGFFRVRPIQGRPLFLFCPHSSAPWHPAAFHRRMQVVFSKKQTSPKEPSQGSFGEAVIKRRIMKDRK